MTAGAAATASAWFITRRSRTKSYGTGLNDGVLDALDVRVMYDRLAPLYDLAASPYNLIGGRRLAKRAITELRLQPGATVVDLGTGTGWNLPRLAEAVGPAGTVIGVDISPGMLTQARRRVDKNNLTAIVELVEADISTYQPPAPTNAVVSTFAIEMRPDYDAIIARLARQIAPGARMITTGLRDPERWPEWLIRAGSMINRIFGVSEDYRGHHPWEAVRAHTDDNLYLDSHTGVIYLAAGTTPGPTTRLADRNGLHCDIGRGRDASSSGGDIVSGGEGE